MADPENEEPGGVPPLVAYGVAGAFALVFVLVLAGGLSLAGKGRALVETERARARLRYADGIERDVTRARELARSGVDLTLASRRVALGAGRKPADREEGSMGGSYVKGGDTYTVTVTPGEGGMVLLESEGEVHTRGEGYGPEARPGPTRASATIRVGARVSAEKIEILETKVVAEKKPEMPEQD